VDSLPHNEQHCLERFSGFRLDQNADQTKTFVVSKHHFDLWGHGEGLYDVQIWRDTGMYFNEAYQGASTMVPVAQGQFRFTDLYTVDALNMGGVRTRVDMWDSMFVYEKADYPWNDLGELYQSSGLPSSFQGGDLVCAFHKTDEAFREKQKRVGFYSTEAGVCSYEVNVVGQYNHVWDWTYTGACAGVTFEVVEKEEAALIADGFPNHTCGSRFDLKQALVQVVQDGVATNWQLLSCANQSFTMTTTLINPNRRRIDASEMEMAGPAPGYTSGN